jgi:hypothetical protein
MAMQSKRRRRGSVSRNAVIGGIIGLLPFRNYPELVGAVGGTVFLAVLLGAATMVYQRFAWEGLAVFAVVTVVVPGSSL